MSQDMTGESEKGFANAVKAHAIRLAEIALAQSRWEEELNAVIGSDIQTPVERGGKLWELLLDLYGIPEDNQPDDYKDEDGVLHQGKWIPGIHYCRDGWYEIWRITAENHSDCKRFVEFVMDPSLIPDDWERWQDLEKLIYGDQLEEP